MKKNKYKFYNKKLGSYVIINAQTKEDAIKEFEKHYDFEPTRIIVEGGENE